jgi:LPS export ABC transporter protein LptC
MRLSAKTVDARCGSLLIVCCAAFLCVTLWCFADDIIKPIQNLRIPLEFYQSGKVKTELTAGLAKIPPKGDIEATDVKLEFLDPQGNVEGRMVADDCHYDKTNGVAKSESNVKMEKQGTVITGKGFVWNSKDEKITILSNVKVILKKDMRIWPGSGK